jgi:hypothetical protein
MLDDGDRRRAALREIIKGLTGLQQRALDAQEPLLAFMISMAVDEAGARAAKGGRYPIVKPLPPG